LENFFVNNLHEAHWDRHATEKIETGANPDLRWCYLVDSTKHASHGLSVGCLVIPVDGELPPHTHAPQEVYFIKSGSGLLLMPDKKTKSVSENDFVYIPNKEMHGLKNTGDKPLEVVWIFPTDCWKEIKYTYSDD
jgi:mannose-6-phosphate isomerase-like protein (cupin superfamily)